jgi:two-component system, cell cycle sensor histidine kinase and response regulator CckA
MPPTTNEPAPAKARIFIVEDEAAVSMEIADRLQKAGYEVCGSAAQGETALSEIEQTNPDILLLDIGLSGKMNGIDLAIALRDRINAGIIFLTAYSDAELLRRARQLQPYAFLVKPFREAELTANIEIGLYRRKCEQEHHRTRTMFQDLFALGPDALLMTDFQGNILDLNRRAESLFGWSREELLGQPVETLIPLAHREKHVGLRLEFTAKPDVREMASDRARVQGLRKNGTVFPAEVLLASLSSTGDRLVVASIRDLTERVAAERQALRSQRLESLGTLACGIAHDLNNTLAPILMSVDLVREGGEDSEQYLDLIESNAERGADMVNRMISFARGEENQREAINAKLLIQDLDRMMRASFPKSIQIQVQSPETLPPIAGDTTQIHQVLLNLCVNARDAMPEGGRLLIAADQIECNATTPSFAGKVQPGTYLRFSVTDSGCGIGPDVLDRMFEPFFTTKTRQEGTGLGLSAVLGIVKGHNGFIHVQSQPGVGSTFEICLPLTPSAKGSDIPPQSRQFDGRGRRILVVDDESSVLETLQLCLKKFNFVLLPATDGKTALELFTEQGNSIDLLLTDINMPEMTGLELIKALHSISPDLPVIAMTGLTDDALVGQLEELKTEIRLRKPFNLPTLVQALRAALPPEQLSSQISGTT